MDKGLGSRCVAIRSTFDVIPSSSKKYENVGGIVIRFAAVIIDHIHRRDNCEIDQDSGITIMSPGVSTITEQDVRNRFTVKSSCDCQMK